MQIIERQLETASGVDDVRLLKSKISECLLGIREEKLRQQLASDAVVNDLNANLSELRGPQAAADTLDRATGLQSRPSAEIAIANATEANATAFMRRDDHIERVRRLLAPITSARLEKTVESRERTVLLHLNFSWTLLQIPTGGKASGTIDKFDAFLSSKIGYEA